MGLTAAGQRRLLICIGEAGDPVTVAALKAMHPDLDGGDVGRGVVRLAMTGLVVMRREGGTLEVAVTSAGQRLLGGPARCVSCGMADPPPDMTCGPRRIDHRVGRAAGCPCCGRLILACARRPCSAMDG